MVIIKTEISIDMIRIDRARKGHRRQMNHASISTIPMANNYRHRFDFDVGYLVKSPCRDCADRYRFPDCMDNCLSLDKIRTVLANSISCSRSYPSAESHAIYQDFGDKK